MKVEKVSRAKHCLVLLFFVLFIFGCGANFQAGGDIAQGRQALFRGNNQIALGYFQNAERTDPNYIHGTELREGVLSYLGRAQYLTGNFAQAKQTLEQSLSQHQGDNIARLYFGLTLARLGDRQRGLRQIEAGLKGIRHFLNYITEAFKFGFGQFWDPNQEIRKAITNNLAMIERRNFDWPALIANGESIAMKMEQEPDQAQLQQQRQRFEEGLN